jgi:hypothetical protein
LLGYLLHTDSGEAYCNERLEGRKKERKNEINKIGNRKK